MLLPWNKNVSIVVDRNQDLRLVEGRKGSYPVGVGTAGEQCALGTAVFQ